MIFWDQERQRIRFTAKHEFEGSHRYSFIGFANENEFEILLSILFERFGDDPITAVQVLTIYQNFMKHLDDLKNIKFDNGIL